jgi:hypothetical protein
MTGPPITSSQLHALLASAESSIRIVGVVPLDLRWDELIRTWSSSFDAGQLQLQVLLESDNQLFAKALVLNSRVSEEPRSFVNLTFIRDEARRALLEAYPTPIREPDIARVLHLDIPINVVEVDGKLYAGSWLYAEGDVLRDLSGSAEATAVVKRYVDTLFGTGLKYASSEDDELLELFDTNRRPRGIFPRHSFYDESYSQLVVWALIFDRKGRLLIHRRGKNAKDNREMWDKSVGGHADFSIDVDTSRAVLREVVEELFKDETRTDFHWTPSDSNIVYLGEWRPEKRHERPFREIAALENEWVFFRLRDHVPDLFSPRRLPSGMSAKLTVSADVYLWVAGAELTDEALDQLKNSEFQLIELTRLKSVVDRVLRGEKVTGFGKRKRHETPEFTPDLIYILTGSIRDVMENFSLYIKRYLSS